MRLYEQLFTAADMNAAEGDYRDHINPNSLTVVHAYVEKLLIDAKAGDKFQFERTGYFCADSVDSKPGAPVFNRTVTLKDSWSKIEKKG